MAGFIYILVDVTRQRRHLIHQALLEIWTERRLSYEHGIPRGIITGTLLLYGLLIIGLSFLAAKPLPNALDDVLDFGSIRGGTGSAPIRVLLHRDT